MITARSELGRAVQRLQDFYRKRIQKDGPSLLAIEREMGDGIARAFLVQRTAVLIALYAGTLTKHRHPGAVKAHPLDRFLDALALRDPIASGQIAAYTLGMNRGASNVGQDTMFNLRNPEAEKYVRDFGGLRITAINETTLERVQTIIERGMANGMSVDDIAEWLTKDAAFSDARAHLIAVTETGQAYGDGNYDKTTSLADELGMTVEKQWILGGHPCDICTENAGDGWIPVDDAFSSGDMNEIVHPNCTCTVEYRTV